MPSFQYGYSINPNGAKFVFLQMEIDSIKELSPSDIIWEFLGSFNKGKLEFTNAVVISGAPRLLIRANFLQKHYNIKYHDTFVHDEVVYIRYIFQSHIKKSLISTIGDKLREVFNDEIRVGLSMPQQGEQQFEFTYAKVKNIEDTLFKKNTDSGIGNINRQALNVANNLQITTVVEKLGLTDIYLDPDLNITTEFGNPFATVSAHYLSSELAIDFFNSEFKCTFLDSTESAKKYRAEGVDIAVGSTLIIKNKGGYYKQGNDGELARITDFTIKVHSIYQLKGGDKRYIVSLRNEEKNMEVSDITWENTANKGKLSDFVQKFGAFHFYGSSNDAVAIHAMVASTDAPVIKSVIGYGWHYEDDICIFGNGVYDRKKKSFTESEMNASGVLLKEDGDGIIPVDTNGQMIGMMLQNKTSLCKVPTKQINPEDYYSAVTALWKDETGVVLFLMACGILGAGLSELKKEVPMFYIRGITQSGKTTFCEVLQNMVGFPKNAAETFGGTNFTQLLLLSSNINLPVFFTEARIACRQYTDKVSNFRSCYDRMPVSRGKADMTTAQYSLSAIPVIEGEEMIGDGATRTRSVQFRPNKKNQLDTKEQFEKAIQKASILQYFTFSYLSTADVKEFQKYKNEFMKKFYKKAGGRNVHNLSIMFASAMCYAPELEESYLTALDTLVQFQDEDEEENGTSIDIIKSVSAFIQKQEYPVFHSEDGIVISWESIQEYSRKYKQDLSLKITSYREHLNALGHTVDFYEVNQLDGLDSGLMLVEGPKFKFDGMDKRLLCNPVIYAQYKLYQQRII